MADSITQKMTQGVKSGVFPGGVLLVAYQGKIRFHKAFGLAQRIPRKTPLTINTIFDLASLTKAVATTPALALLIQHGDVRLQDPVSTFFAEFKTGNKKKVTLFHLLNHSSGLPDWRPYYEEIVRQDRKYPGFLGSPEAKRRVYEMARSEPLVCPPGMMARYSDIGFIVLGEIIEKITGMPLNQFCDQEIFSKLKLKKTFFPGRHRIAATQFAATEDLPWRGGVIRGDVHDDNTYAMGGVSGHAGLFGTAREVYTLVTLWLDSLRGVGLIEQTLANRCVTRQRGKTAPRGSTWGFGWDTPSRGGSSSGQFFSQSSFGHLGYTGTSIWVDRVAELVVILLTNRVHPSRENKQIQSFRPELHNIVFNEVVNG